jgi:hypothetical protein
MGQKMVRFAELCGTRSRQDASKEVHEAGRIRPSSGCNGVHVRWWIGLICALLGLLGRAFALIIGSKLEHGSSPGSRAGQTNGD